MIAQLSAQTKTVSLKMRLRSCSLPSFFQTQEIRLPNEAAYLFLTMSALYVPDYNISA
jgi:hypothetical protein